MPNSFLRRPNAHAPLFPEDVEAYRRAAALEAAAAAFAIVAQAGHAETSVQRARLLRASRREPLLYAFTRADILEELSLHEEAYHLDAEVAEEIAIEKVQPMRGRAQEARCIMRVARAALDGAECVEEQRRALAKIALVVQAARLAQPLPPAHAD